MPKADLPDFNSFDVSAAPSRIAGLLSQWQEVIEAALNDSEPGWSLVEQEVECSARVQEQWSTLSHLCGVADSEELREAYKEALAALTRHSSWRQQHAGLCRYFKSLSSSEAFATLPADQRRIAELELRDFRLAGVELGEKDKRTYRQIRQRLSELGTLFSENVLDATQAWNLHLDNPQRLAGLPVNEKKLLRQLAQKKGRSGWLIDLTEPSFMAVMMNAEDRELRREVYLAYQTRASDQGPNASRWDNTPVIMETLQLRHRLARLLGFEQYADLALSTRMAKGRDEVAEFLHELARRARPVARQQLDELSQFAESRGARLPLKAWDIAFWSERLRAQKLELSDDVLKPFFPLDQMLGALKFVIDKLFDVRLSEDASIATWHRDARFFWLEDGEENRIGGIYMDLYAREAKRGGAWMGECRSRRMGREDLQLPIAYLTCNFSPPVGDQPSLLAHHEMTTLFHEMGHCLHHLLTTVDWPQIGGINNVEWDAVELPSQLLENWCWVDEVLERFARHHASGEPLPADLKQRLLESRTFLKAMFLVRQLEYALLDWRLHSEYDPNNPPDLVRLAREVREEVSVVKVPEENRFLNGFVHIFGGGYSAGYYSYLWAEELAADAWDYFRDNGTLRRRSGARLRTEILSVGASRPASESFRAFRGREARPEPLLKSYGVAESGKSAAG